MKWLAGNTFTKWVIYDYLIILWIIFCRRFKFSTNSVMSYKYNFLHSLCRILAWYFVARFGRFFRYCEYHKSNEKDLCRKFKRWFHWPYIRKVMFVARSEREYYIHGSIASPVFIDFPLTTHIYGITDACKSQKLFSLFLIDDRRKNVLVFFSQKGEYFLKLIDWLLIWLEKIYKIDWTRCYE